LRTEQTFADVKACIPILVQLAKSDILGGGSALY